MRTALQALVGTKRRFIAVFERYGSYVRNGVAGKTILLSSLTDTRGTKLAAHIWINYTASFDNAGTFEKGDVVQFDAWVREYVKGYFGGEINKRIQSPPALDYSLAFPRNVHKIGRRICSSRMDKHTQSKCHDLIKGQYISKEHVEKNSNLSTSGVKRRIVLGVC